MARRASVAVATAILALGALPACGAAQPTGATVARPPRRRAARSRLKRIGNFDHPTYVTGAPGFPKLLFVVEQPGRVRVLRSGHELKAPFLDLRGTVGYDGGERGLLSIAFPPDYRKTGRFYVYYTDRDGNIRIDEFKRRSRDAGGARLASRGDRDPPPGPTPTTTAARCSSSATSSTSAPATAAPAATRPTTPRTATSLLGKLLRIDPRASGGRPYSIPPSNPFVGRPGRDEIYSYGLRNPFRFSFDSAVAGRPRIAIADVGQDRFEELDYTTVAAASGANFGWDAFEGFAPYTGDNSGTPDPGGTVKPIFAYSHSRDGGSCSIIGGYVVRDRRLRALVGRYLYADLLLGAAAQPGPPPGSGERRPQASASPSLRPTSFGEDDRGPRLRRLAGRSRLPARAMRPIANVTI